MKIVSKTELNNLVASLKAAGETIVFTNGCFDVLHVGHVRYLAAARKLGTCLIVGLNSDTSVRQLKGPARPINNQDDRAEVLAALAAVDYVVMFEERTAEQLVQQIQPHVYVKGGDYRVDELPEAPIVKAYGGKIVLVPEVPDRSTTNTIRKIANQTV